MASLGGFLNDNGGGTKVLWVTHGGEAGSRGTPHPLGRAEPVVSFTFPGPSTVTVPTAGCWRFELTVGSQHATMDVLVAPARP